VGAERSSDGNIIEQSNTNKSAVNQYSNKIVTILIYQTELKKQIKVLLLPLLRAFHFFDNAKFLKHQNLLKYNARLNFGFSVANSQKRFFR
jgi:hypothetical protein